MSKKVFDSYIDFSGQMYINFCGANPSIFRNASCGF